MGVEVTAEFKSLGTAGDGADKFADIKLKEVKMLGIT